MQQFQEISRTATANINPLTPDRRVLPKQLTVSHLLKEITAFHETRRFLTAFTKARDLFPS